MKITMALIKKLLKIIMWTILILIGFVGCTVVNLWFDQEANIKEKMDRKAFDIDKWGDYQYSRINMYSDLRKHYVYEGMTVKKVKELLGEESAKRIYKTASRQLVCLEYSLGVVEGLLWDSYFDLIVCPDDSENEVKTIKLLRNDGDDGKTISKNQ